MTPASASGGARETLHHTPRKPLVIVVALVAVAAALAASPASAKGPKPLISNFAASPATVPAGGTTTVTASVSGATQCTLDSNKAVEGLPITFPCESGTVERKVTMPINSGAQRAAKYKLYLKATNAEGRSRKAKMTVLVESAFTVELVQRLEGEATYTQSKVLRGKAPLTVEYEIVVSNIAEEQPVYVDSIVDLLVPGCQTVSPKQREVKPGENDVVEATCAHTVEFPNESFENEVEVRGKFDPHGQPCSFEVFRWDRAETEPA
jgi:hypothetical protein